MTLREALTQRGMSPNVVNRVMKFYPESTLVSEVHGSVLRGLQYKARRSYFGSVGKGEFIRRFGRDAWAAIPKCLKYRDGRRQCVTREAVEDNIWLTYQGKGGTHATFPANNRYANDPDCRIEIRAIAA